MASSTVFSPWLHPKMLADCKRRNPLQSSIPQLPSSASHCNSHRSVDMHASAGSTGTSGKMSLLAINAHRTPPEYTGPAVWNQFWGSNPGLHRQRSGNASAESVEWDPAHDDDVPPYYAGGLQDNSPGLGWVNGSVCKDYARARARMHNRQRSRARTHAYGRLTPVAVEIVAAAVPASCTRRWSGKTGSSGPAGIRDLATPAGMRGRRSSAKTQECRSLSLFVDRDHSCLRPPNIPDRQV